MIRDFFDIITECIAYMGGGEFFTAILVAIVLGVLCWVGCSKYTLLWHKHFRVKFQHHLLCAIAAVLTVLFTVHFRAVGNLEYIVDDIIDDWYEYLTEDDEFNSETYSLAFYTLKDAYPDEFTGIPEPGRRGSIIPASNDDMIQGCVEIYVEEACDHFSTIHPFLNWMLSARPGVSEDDITYDINDFFRKNPGTAYPLERAVEIAAEHIRESLLEQSPKTVWKTRLILVLLFLMVQLIPFGTISYCAYRELKMEKYRYNQSNNIDSWN